MIKKIGNQVSVVIIKNEIQKDHCWKSVLIKCGNDPDKLEGKTNF